MQHSMDIAYKFGENVKGKWRYLKALILIGCLFPLMSGTPATAMDEPPARIVHAPYFSDDVLYTQTAVIWYGRITPSENYTDIRIGYNDDHLYVNFAVSDRRLWYDRTPSVADMTKWDTVSLFLDLDGNTGSAPDAHAYRFVAQLNHWQARDDYQAAYRGNGSGWQLASIPFTTSSGWRGDAPNTNEDDRGWIMTFNIPYTSLGLSGKPPRDTIWGLGLVTHDRDDADGTPIADKVWPEQMSINNPASWGKLSFGRPQPQTPPPIVPGSESTTTVREGLNGVIVPDAAVGGHSTCGGGLDYWTEWGNQSYGNLAEINIQNIGDISDWPCNSKYYIEFPLDLVPPGKVILDASITLHQFGGAGAGYSPPPQRSLIQAWTVEEAWDESTLTWNNAPLAGHYVGATWVDPTDAYLGQPGKPWHWTVTPAVTEAYAAGKPLNLVFYEADWAYHAGKYFRASEEEAYDAIGRPTLIITWADVASAIDAVVRPTEVTAGDTVVFNLIINGSGQPLTVTDRLPDGLSQPTSVSPDLTFTPPDRFAWMGSPDLGEQVTLAYTATVAAAARTTIANQAVMTQAPGLVFTAQAVAFVDPVRIFLPIVMKQP